ncbi:glycosyltransferase family 4 protein [Caldisericum exile]|uniref:Glycosyltransferase n=1 Tax=Caldisericum exile (strain DSM 21853 / NBRC 104410 / AZM16c01) TaxID=511051 RepID=A0A7U6GG15_CALEA|nr:glycosyltransferase family 4 protein [Caldisericum exile]BAL81656.1 putative glycosyltransferase [Caldisericum exile AZM16c01]
MKKTIKKILFLATVDSHIYYFHIPFMKLLRDMGYEVEVACSNVGFTDKIEVEGFRVHNIPFSRNPLSISNIRSAIELYKLVKKENYIMLHTHTPVASFIGRIVGRIAGIPHIVYTAHGFHFHEYGNPLMNLIYFHLEKFAGRFTDVLITINTDDYKIAKEKKIVPNGKIIYLKGVGVDTEKFKAESENLDKNFNVGKSFVFTSVGRMEKEKHFDHLLKAFYVVSQKNKNFELVLIGDGKCYDSLRNLSYGLSLEDYIRFVGYLEDIKPYLGSSLAFVFTSSREGLPVSVMEAMAMEKPVVSYNIRGVRDLIEDGVNGFLVPFGDIEGLADKIIYLMENPEVAKEMGKRGREKIEREFSLNIILAQMKYIYKEILETQGQNFENEK